MREIAKIEEGTLVIAPRVAEIERADITILDFVLITGSRAKSGKQVTRLREQAAAIVFIGSDEREIAGNCGNSIGRAWRAKRIVRVGEIGKRIGVELMIVGFGAASCPRR